MGTLFSSFGYNDFLTNFKASRSKTGLAASNSATVILYCFAMGTLFLAVKPTTSDVGSFSLDFSKSSLLLLNYFFPDSIFLVSFIGSTKIRLSFDLIRFLGF
jgi:hypothetical protein